MKNALKRRVVLDRTGLSIDGTGINFAGLLLVIGVAIVVFATDDWWKGMIVLAFIPLTIAYFWLGRRLGFVYERGWRPLSKDIAFRFRPDSLNIWPKEVGEVALRARWRTDRGANSTYHFLELAGFTPRLTQGEFSWEIELDPIDSTSAIEVISELLAAPDPSYERWRFAGRSG